MPRKKKETTKEVVEIVEETPVEKPTKSSKKEGFVTGTGRRKTAIASVFLWDQKGDFTINGKDIDEVLTTDIESNVWLKPFHTVGVSHPKARFKASIRVSGSGKSSQLGAIAHGLSRALAKLSTENHEVLAKAGLLTRDSRMVERKKYFLHKARKGPQYSKR